MDANETLGQRLVAAVVPSRFKDLNALHRETGFAYSTVHKWKTGESNPRWEQVEAIAALAGANAFRLIAGAEPSERQRAGDHPDWAGALAKAQQRFPNRIPERMYAIAADTSGVSMPEHIDELFVFELAQFWHQFANDRELAQADTAAALRELDALRGSTKASKR